jgi:hypothetical protein
MSQWVRDGDENGVGIMCQWVRWVRDGDEDAVEWKRPASEVVKFEGVKNPSTRLIQVRPEEMIVAVQALDEHA